MMLTMMQINPSLVQASSDRSSVISTLSSQNGDLSSRIDSLKLDESLSTFTFIPPDSRSTYRDLVERCLDYDLDMLKSLPEDEDVSLGVLSADHLALLAECATRWRLPPAFRTWTFLSAVVELFEAGTVPAACLHQATEMVAKLSTESPISEWAISDVSATPQRPAISSWQILPSLTRSVPA